MLRCPNCGHVIPEKAIREEVAQLMNKRRPRPKLSHTKAQEMEALIRVNSCNKPAEFCFSAIILGCADNKTPYPSLAAEFGVKGTTDFLSSAVNARSLARVSLRA